MRQGMHAGGCTVSLLHQKHPFLDLPDQWQVPPIPMDEAMGRCSSPSSGLLKGKCLLMGEITNPHHVILFPCSQEKLLVFSLLLQITIVFFACHH